MDHQSTGALVTLVPRVYHGSGQHLFHSTTFLSATFMGLEYMFIKILFVRKLRENLTHSKIRNWGYLNR